MLLGVSLACEFFHEQLREVHGIVFSYSWEGRAANDRAGEAP
jgi:hypothetical protein